jgi:hypothetical protein
MERHASEQSRTLAAVANRLRMVQHDLADQPPAARADGLAAELARGLSDVAPAQRPAFLEALRRHFPVWNADDAPGAGAGRDEDPRWLVAQLTRAAEGLDEKQRQRLGARLSRIGLSAPPPARSFSDEATAEFRRRLKLDADAAVDPDLALDLAGRLAECLASLNKVAWPTWREINPRSRLRGPADLRQEMARRLAQGKTPEELDADLERLRQLVAALVGAIRGAGSEYAQRYLERFTVRAIESLVDVEGIGLLVNRDVRCWRKFKELSQGLDRETIEREILRAVANHANRLLEVTDTEA